MKITLPRLPDLLRSAAALALACWLAPAAANAAATTVTVVTHEMVSDQTPPPQQAATAAMLKSFDRSVFQAAVFQGSANALPYRLLAPSAPQPGRRYPLVMVLHGSGAVGTDNQAQLDRLAVSWATPAIRERFQAYILVPQFPARSANYVKSAADGVLAGQAGASLQSALELVEHLKQQLPIAADSVYVAGFSMGASASLQSLLLRPGLFSAAVAFSGIAPERSEASRLAATPLLIVHGNADSENLIDADLAMVAALQRQPGARARFLEYKDMDHMVPADMLLDTVWRDWLFAQHKAN